MPPYSHQIPSKDLHFLSLRHLFNPTFPFSTFSTLRYLHIPTFGRQFIRGQRFHRAVIKANYPSRTRHLSNSTIAQPFDTGTLREVDHLYVRLLRGLRKSANMLQFSFLWRGTKGLVIEVHSLQRARNFHCDDFTDFVVFAE